MNILPVEIKIQNASFQLNRDAYRLQANGKTKMRQFTPCAKSLVLLACLRDGTHFGMAMATAALIPCECHRDLSEDGLYKLCFDDTARKAHYAA